MAPKVQTVSETLFSGVRKVALCILTMFGSKHKSQAVISTLNMIKTKHHPRLNTEHLHMCLRSALTPFKLRFKILEGYAGKLELNSLTEYKCGEVG